MSRNVNVTLIAVIVAAIVAFSPFVSSANDTTCNATVHRVTVEKYEDGSTSNIAYVSPVGNDTLKISYVGEYSTDVLTTGCAYMSGPMDVSGMERGVISQYTVNGDVMTFTYMVIATDDTAILPIYTVHIPVVIK